MGVNVVLFSLVLTQFLSLWGAVSERLSGQLFRFDLAVSALISSLFGIGLQFFTLRLGLLEGSMFMFTFAVSLVFLLPLLSSQSPYMPWETHPAMRLEALRSVEGIAVCVLLVYIVCSSVFYSVLTAGMLHYSLQGVNHKIAGIICTLAILVLLQATKNQDRKLVFGIVFFVIACIVVLYCIALFGVIEFQSSRTMLLLTRALAFFITIFIAVELSSVRRYSLSVLFAAAVLPALLLSRSVMFGGWAFLQFMDPVVPAKTMTLFFCSGKHFCADAGLLPSGV